jgi:hypothetical protein
MGGEIAQHPVGIVARVTAREADQLNTIVFKGGRYFPCDMVRALHQISNDQVIADAKSSVWSGKTAHAG